MGVEGSGGVEGTVGGGTTIVVDGAMLGGAPTIGLAGEIGVKVEPPALAPMLPVGVLNRLGGAPTTLGGVLNPLGGVGLPTTPGVAPV